jgi:hypothetical protein
VKTILIVGGGIFHYLAWQVIFGMRVVTRDVQRGRNIMVRSDCMTTVRICLICVILREYVYLIPVLLLAPGLFRVFAMHQRLWITADMVSFLSSIRAD